MRKFGIIGGLGPEATVDYYKRIVQFFHQHHQGLSTPEMLIYSADITALFRLVEDQRWDGLEQWLLEKVAALKQAGAEFAAISANTPHIVFDRLAARSPLPLISIVAATLAAARRQGFKRVGLLGTRFTMQANFFGQHFAQAGIQVLVPSPAEQDYLHDKLVSEIEHGIFTPPDPARASGDHRADGGTRGGRGDHSRLYRATADPGAERHPAALAQHHRAACRRYLPALPATGLSLS
ncbi:MAG: amino acid racemase [Aeromonadaceae bacterium]|nr:amino acid racemase [Aeromonadaceae bacterium]